MLVYKFDQTHVTNVSPKLTPKYKGPYRVKYLLGNNVARLENVFTGREEPNLINIDHLKTANDCRQLLRHLCPQTQQQTVPASVLLPNQSQGDTIDQQSHGERVR
jgi:hypothetical protein